MVGLSEKYLDVLSLNILRHSFMLCVSALATLAVPQAFSLAGRIAVWVRYSPVC